MAESHQTGKSGEQIACDYLKKKGFQVLETNWRTGPLEIDIIAKKGDMLVIAEVKARRTIFFGQPEEFVNRSKQRMLIKAANRYLFSNELDLEVRFDIISVLMNDESYKINHIEDAFYPTL